jgi:hypothetical protein
MCLFNKYLWAFSKLTIMWTNNKMVKNLKIKIDQFVEFSKLNLIIYIMSVFIFLRDELFISKDRKNHNY